MPRNKYPEITEKRILDTATKLFVEKGWEETTIQDIVDDLGDLTRGAFYHHFKSKEDIIDAVLNRLANENDPFKKSKNISGLNGLERLRMAFLLSFENIGQLEAIKTIPTILNSPKLIAKQLQDCVNSGAPDILAFIDEGVMDGSISVQYPKQTSETFMLLTNIWLSPIIFSVDTEEYLLKVKHLQELFNSIGLPVIDDQIIDILEKFHKSILNI
ncbi:TetR/AcrR family transcriptional regulator [Paenibacillus sp. BSR1-1]|uniref:TetR/AcrR family transcriptional regulator n=1 Tax=Paenibacillus sp. BSR1-1 TaxID=3020845 RepID=UPI0025B08103|nr:TetR/AcrR family transcriptional regulator [Paenibacillus sp. BSR1-1]MDN3015874.1 TetR/AcrR family transcriptional regulator [Paenibacillus sp. BSR1-1]